MPFVSSAIVPTTPSERPQTANFPIYIFLHHRSTSRSRRRTHSARARAFFSFFSYLRYKNEKRDRRAQTHEWSFVIRDRSDDAFGPISNIVLCSLVIIARRREAEEEPIAPARVPSFPSSLICDTKTKRETDELRSLALLSSAIVPTTPSERPQITSIFLHHRSTSRSRRRTHSARARARLLLFLSPFYSRDFYERKQEEKTKDKVRELR